MDLKQAIIVRSDLGMGKGKLAAQAAHAAVSAADKSPYKRDWVAEGQRKVVLKVTSEAQLIEVMRVATLEGLATAMIEDAGRTQIPSGTKTAVGIGPALEKDIDHVTEKLKLL